MRAVVYEEPGRVRLTEVPEPALIEPTDAIVRVRRAAICGTDLHVVKHGTGMRAGMVIGHEFVGTVESVGTGVRLVRAGERVAGADYAACGSCWYCRRGSHWECAQRRFFGTGSAFGPELPGCHAELVRVPFADVVLRAVPPEITDADALFVGDVLATGLAAATRGGVAPGDVVAVLGGGPVGQLCAQAALAVGAAAVVVSEPLEMRRDIARQCGVVAVDPVQTGALLRSLTDGRGADVVVDAVGGASLLDAALDLVRPAGVIASVGVPGDAPWTPDLRRLFGAEVDLRFVVGNAMRDFDALFALLRGRRVDPSPLVTSVIPLEGVPDALAGGGAGLKTLVEV